MSKFVIYFLLLISSHLLASEDKILNSQEALDKYKLEIQKIKTLKMPEDAKRIDDIKKTALKQLQIDFNSARIQSQKTNDNRHELAKKNTTKEEWRKFYLEEKLIFEEDKKTWDEYYSILTSDWNEVEKQLEKEKIEKKLADEDLAKTRIEIEGSEKTNAKLKSELELKDAEIKIREEAIAKKKVILEAILNKSRNMITIDSTSHLGGTIGLVNKDQTISVQYKFGKWSPNSPSMLSPDEIKKSDNAQNYDAGIFSIKEDNSVELIKRIPLNTEENSFNFKFEKDYSKVAIRICDGLLAKDLIDNKGIVVYEVILATK